MTNSTQDDEESTVVLEIELRPQAVPENGPACPLANPGSFRFKVNAVPGKNELSVTCWYKLPSPESGEDRDKVLAGFRIGYLLLRLKGIRPGNDRSADLFQKVIVQTDGHLKQMAGLTTLKCELLQKTNETCSTMKYEAFAQAKLVHVDNGEICLYEANLEPFCLVPE